MIDARRWDYKFYEIATGLKLEDRLKVVGEAIDMYLSKDKERSLKGERYEGRLYQDGSGVLGGFAGTIYRAELETNKGKQKMSFLIIEKIKQEWN